MNKYVLIFLAGVVVAAFSQIILKMSARRTHTSVIREYLNLYVIAGYGLMVLSTVLTLLAYRGLDYKNGPVIESLGYILVMFLSRAFFGEKITRHKLLGNLIILVGIFVFYL